VQSLHAPRDVPRENENLNVGKSNMGFLFIYVVMLTDNTTDDEAEDDSRAVLEIYRQNNRPTKPPDPRALVRQQ
jgi:hypothetical protein